MLAEFHKHKTRALTMRSVWTLRKAYVMFVCLVLQSISSGVAVSLSVMFAELVDVFDAPRLKAVLIQGLFGLCMASGGILWTGVFRKVGTGLPVICGTLVACLGLFLSSFSPNLEVIVICTGIIGGFGSSISIIAIFVTISWVFHEDPKFPLTLVTIGASVGQIILAYLCDVFITMYAWSGAFLCLTAVTLQCVPCGLVLHFSRDIFVNEKSGNTYTAHNDCSINVLKDVVVWLFLIMDFIWIMSAYMKIWFIVDQVVSAGFSRENGTFMLSIIGCTNLIGRITGSVLRYRCNTVPSILHWLYVCPMVMIGHVLIIAYQHNFTVFFVACVIHGLGIGTTVSLIPTVVYECTSHDMYPQVMGLANVSFGLANLSVNLFGGKLRDIFGGYEVVYYLAIGGAIIVTMMSGWLLYIIHSRRKNQDILISNGVTTRAKYETFK